MILTAAVPVQPDQEQARSWLIQELSQPEYQDARPGLVQRALTWFWDRLQLIDLGTGAPAGIGALVITLVIAIVIVYAVRRAGGLRSTARRRRATRVLSARTSSAADHRAAAERHAAAQEWEQAVVERFRAVARELEERALLRPQPGRTAVEVAREGAAARPDLRAELLAAARAFDDVSYGHLSVGRAADDVIRELDEQLRSTTAPASLALAGRASAGTDLTGADLTGGADSLVQR